MIRAALRDDAFLADVADTGTDPDVFHLWWLGRSGYLIKWGESHVLIEPCLSDSLTEKYAGTDKPHARMTEWMKLCLKHAPPERLSFAPDCGLSQTARRAAREKLLNLVAGTRLVRQQLRLE